MFKRTKISAGVMLALGGTLTLGAMPAIAQQTLERVEITGSSIKRVDAETALPVTIIKREDIERTGATTAQDIVNMIPSNFGGTVVANNIGATNATPSTANLRSLGSKYTLVLLNGRRVANYALGNSPVDLNSIPLSAIERIEVLRDGASAVYGADAIAGVINFILKRDYQGIEATLYGTKNSRSGGGATKSFNVTGGFGDIAKDRFNILLSANHEDDDVLKATDRAFAASANRPDLGINKASPRNGIPNLNFTDTAGNGYGTLGNGVAPAINPLRYNGCVSDFYALVIRNDSQCGTDYVRFIDLIPKQKHDNLVARGVFQVSSDIELYAEAAYTKDNTVSTYSPAPYTVTMTYPAAGRFYPSTITLPKGITLKAGYVMPDGSVLAADTVLAADMAVTPTGNITGTWRTVAGGGRVDITDATNTRFLLGSKGVFAGWDYDTAVTFSRNKAETSFGNGQYSYSLLTPLVSAGNINVFGDQDATSLADLASASLIGQLQQSAVSKSTEFDFRVSKEVAQMPAGPLGLALGVSLRKEDLAQNPGPVLLTGDNVGGGGSVPAVTGSRKVNGVFAEVNVPVIKDLEFQGAARYDSYKNSFGTSFSKLSPKMALRYQPSKELVARASYGQGYRAPTLYENLRPRTTDNNTNANWSDPIRCPNGVPINNTVDESSECNVQLTAGTEGSKDLKPEKSTQYSLGLVFQASSSLVASIDYWDVKVNNAIVPKSEIAVLSDANRFANYYYRGSPAVPSSDPTLPLAYVFLPYENAAQIYAAGIDMNVAYREKLSIGSFGINADATYFTKHGYKYTDLPTATSDLGGYKDFGPVPRLRSAITLSLARGAWTGSVTHNYTAGYEDYFNPTAEVGPDYPASRRVSAFETFDAQLGWHGLKSLELVAGIKNIFDKEPPSSRTEANFQTGYDATYSNPLGRVYYFRARYKFF